MINLLLLSIMLGKIILFIYIVSVCYMYIGMFF